MFHKIIWAMDPAKESATLRRKLVRALKAFSRGMECTVEPVHVLSGEPMLFPMAYDANERKLLAAGLEKLFRRAKIADILSPRFLDCDRPTVRAQVETLLKYAYDSGSDLIAAATHARRGIRRMALGSFVETLLLHSRVPILSVNPGARIVPTFREILFPSDFDPLALPYYENILDAALAWNAKVTLLHQPEISTTPPWALSPPGMPPLLGVEELRRDRIKHEMEDAHKEGERWRSAAQKRGISAEVIFDEGVENIDRIILSHAESIDAGLVAIASRTGAVGAALLGSTARNVIRAASCPVLAMHVTTTEAHAGAPRAA